MRGNDDQRLDLGRRHALPGPEFQFPDNGDCSSTETRFEMDSHVVVAVARS
jgi:hypothetical protein